MKGFLKYKGVLMIYKQASQGVLKKSIQQNPVLGNFIIRECHHCITCNFENFLKQLLCRTFLKSCF